MINFAEFKRFFIFNMIIALIVCALVAVISILIGSFTDTAAKALFTLLMVIVHSLIALTFIWDDEKQGTFNRLSFFINVIFVLIVVSFFTSIFGIWDIFSGETVWETYRLFFVIGFAALHSDILSKALNRKTYLDLVVFLNYLFITIVVLMFLPIIYLENVTATLGPLFFRLFASAAIIDGTLSILTIIFYRLYMKANPKIESPLAYGPEGGKQKRRGLSIWVWILIIYLALQVFLPLLFMGPRLLFG
jgi:hypothetical protein